MSTLESVYLNKILFVEDHGIGFRTDNSQNTLIQFDTGEPLDNVVDKQAVIGKLVECIDLLKGVHTTIIKEEIVGEQTANKIQQLSDEINDLYDWIKFKKINSDES